MGIRRFLGSLVVGVPFGIVFLDTVGSISKVDGISMWPTLNPNKDNTDYVILNRWAANNQDIKRGEVVALTSPKHPEQTLIKRVVGIAGDIIHTHGYKLEVLQVPEGHCWVEGDNINRSTDSNIFGPVSIGLITAKATHIIWPLSRLQCLQPSMLNHRFPLNVSKAPAG
ncbi:mitochondrial inner membrane protease subunit 2-like [Colletes gigas]|uniref:mitochondrial inner membrane protease subunit 2-like n=1 Tax=Colletes gigas TaxID=935657 RepID=UPI001C9A90A7|nr:mitochondrial inner membrane protease subunit 2-like [Colletes gigas]XP_043256627.1 mitochondrial inner membrane protease subunit 2-like [Colletes gigas]